MVKVGARGLKPKGETELIWCFTDAVAETTEREATQRVVCRFDLAMGLRLPSTNRLVVPGSEHFSGCSTILITSHGAGEALPRISAT